MWFQWQPQTNELRYKTIKYIETNAIKFFIYGNYVQDYQILG